MKWRVRKFPALFGTKKVIKKPQNFQKYGKEKRSKTLIPPRSSPHGLLRVTRTSHIFHFPLIMRDLRALHHSEKQTTPPAITISRLMLPERAEGKLWLEPQVLGVFQQLLKCTEIMFWFAQELLLPHFKQIMALLSDTFAAKRRREISFCKSPPLQHFHPRGVVSEEQLGHRDALSHRVTPPSPNIPTSPGK